MEAPTKNMNNEPTDKDLDRPMDCYVLRILMRGLKANTTYTSIDILDRVIKLQDVYMHAYKNKYK